MGLISVVLLVILIVSAVLLVLVVLVQDDQGEGLGGIFGGGSTTPFGSRSGNVLTRFTAILAAVFLFCIFGHCVGQQDPRGRERHRPSPGRVPPGGKPAAELVGADPRRSRCVEPADAAILRGRAGSIRTAPRRPPRSAAAGAAKTPASSAARQRGATRVGVLLHDLFSAPRIKCHLEAEDKAEVFEELVDLLVTQYRTDSRDEILDAIRQA